VAIRSLWHSSRLSLVGKHYSSHRFMLLRHGAQST